MLSQSLSAHWVTLQSSDSLPVKAFTKGTGHYLRPGRGDRQVRRMNLSCSFTSQFSIRFGLIEGRGAKT